MIYLMKRKKNMFRHCLSITHHHQLKFINFITIILEVTSIMICDWMINKLFNNK